MQKSQPTAENLLKYTIPPVQEQQDGSEINGEMNPVRNARYLGGRWKNMQRQHLPPIMEVI